MEQSSTDYRMFSWSVVEKKGSDKFSWKILLALIICGVGLISLIGVMSQNAGLASYEFLIMMTIFVCVVLGVLYAFWKSIDNQSSGTVHNYSISNNGLAVDNKLYKFKDFDEPTVLECLEPFICKDGWRQAPEGAFTNIKIKHTKGKINLVFPDQRTVARFAESMLEYIKKT